MDKAIEFELSATCLFFLKLGSALPYSNPCMRFSEVCSNVTEDQHDSVLCGTQDHDKTCNITAQTTLRTARCVSAQVCMRSRAVHSLQGRSTLQADCLQCLAGCVCHCLTRKLSPE